MTSSSRTVSSTYIFAHLRAIYSFRFFVYYTFLDTAIPRPRPTLTVLFFALYIVHWTLRRMTCDARCIYMRTLTSIAQKHTYVRIIRLLISFTPNLTMESKYDSEQSRKEVKLHQDRSDPDENRALLQSYQRPFATPPTRFCYTPHTAHRTLHTAHCTLHFLISSRPKVPIATGTTPTPSRFRNPFLSSLFLLLLCFLSSSSSASFSIYISHRSKTPPNPLTSPSLNILHLSLFIFGLRQSLSFGEWEFGIGQEGCEPT